MKRLNNRWYDENNNSWTANIDSEESALAKSKTLTNCNYCKDCRNCRDCNNCDYCWDCNDCIDCNNSNNCSNCRNCKNCNSCRYCKSCNYCNSCSYCKSCNDCSEIKKNPQRYTTPKIGSRDSQTSIYWTNKDDIQIMCGCWRGNIEEFEKKVKIVHKDTKYLQPYLKQIKIFKYLRRECINRQIKKKNINTSLLI